MMNICPRYKCEISSNRIKYVRENGTTVFESELVYKEVEIMNKVKMYRTACGLTQKEMAEVIGVHENTYRTLEENPSKFNVEQVTKFVTKIREFDSSVKASDIFYI